jgi:hypothetical protein
LPIFRTGARIAITYDNEHSTVHVSYQQSYYYNIAVNHCPSLLSAKGPDIKRERTYVTSIDGTGGRGHMAGNQKEIILLIPSGPRLPVLVAAAGAKASRRFVEFFTANIRKGEQDIGAKVAKSICSHFRFDDFQSFCEVLTFETRAAVLKQVSVRGRRVRRAESRDHVTPSRAILIRWIFESRTLGYRSRVHFPWISPHRAYPQSTD